MEKLNLNELSFLIAAYEGTLFRRTSGSMVARSLTSLIEMGMLDDEYEVTSKGERRLQEALGEVA